METLWTALVNHTATVVFEYTGENEVDIAVDIASLNNEKSKTATGLEALWTSLINHTATVGYMEHARENKD